MSIGGGFRLPELSILSIKREVKTGLISATQRLNPDMDIIIQKGSIRLAVDAIFFQLARVASNQQVIEGITDFVNQNGSLSDLSVNQILSVFNNQQLSIPPFTYNKIQEGVNKNIADIALIALTVKTMGLLECNLTGFTAPEETPFEFLTKLIYDEIVFEYLFKNIKSIVANPDPDQAKVRSLLVSGGIDEVIQCIDDLYGPFGALKYFDVTNCNYKQPLRIPNQKIISEVVTTVISDRLQIPPSSIETEVDNLSDSQLTSLLINIEQYPRLRTAVIKLGLEELDQAIVDGLMVDKFLMVREYFLQALVPDKVEEGRVIFTDTLMNPGLREYTPILLEMNYQSPSINQSVGTNLSRVKLDVVQPLLDFMYKNLSPLLEWLLPSHVLPPNLESEIDKTIINPRRQKKHVIVTDTKEVEITPTTIYYGLLRYNNQTINNRD